MAELLLLPFNGYRATALFMLWIPTTDLHSEWHTPRQVRVGGHPSCQCGWRKKVQYNTSNVKAQELKQVSWKFSTESISQQFSASNSFKFGHTQDCFMLGYQMKSKTNNAEFVLWCLLKKKKKIIKGSVLQAITVKCHINVCNREDPDMMMHLVRLDKSLVKDLLNLTTPVWSSSVELIKVLE